MSTNLLNPQGLVPAQSGIKQKAARWLAEKCSQAELQQLASLDTAEKKIEQIKTWCHDPELFFEFERLQFSKTELTARRRAERERNTPKLFRRGPLPKVSLEDFVAGRGRWKSLDRVHQEAVEAEASKKRDFEHPELIAAPEVEF